ncbi:hypothetical protein RSAG8_12876, partial [Rhizoctonia solani AG-8 WAC10335]
MPTALRIQSTDLGFDIQYCPVLPVATFFPSVRDIISKPVQITGLSTLFTYH